MPMIDYDPFSEAVATDPLPIYRELRAAGGDGGTFSACRGQRVFNWSSL